MVDPHTRQTLPRGQVRLRAGCSWLPCVHAVSGREAGNVPKSAVMPCPCQLCVHLLLPSHQAPPGHHLAMQVGELCVRGYSVMLGYWGDPAATASSIDEVGGRVSADWAACRRASGRAGARVRGRLGAAPSSSAPPNHLPGPLLPQGWMHSGDLAVLDSRGYLSIVGRMKDMVIRGGENIYPVSCGGSPRWLGMSAAGLLLPEQCPACAGSTLRPRCS